FLDLCAVFQGMCHNEPEHLEAVNAMLEKMAK
ncbi:MAG: enoyl-CoA hydratase, partial [Pseudomonadota bacterium]